MFPHGPLPTVKRPEGSKPRFERDIGIHFSVSHSGDYWVCAVSRREVGLDIQFRGAEYRREIAKRFFHPEEYEYLESNDYRDFFTIWTAKESYVKFNGRGIGGLSDFSVVSSFTGGETAGRIRGEISGIRIRFFSFDPDYCMCLCAADTRDVDLIRIQRYLICQS